MVPAVEAVPAVTYDTSHIVVDYIKFLKGLQDLTDHEAHALRFARLLKMRVKMGLINRAYPEALPNPVIVVQPWYFGNSDMLRHETAHVALYWSGLETEILAEFGPDLGWKVIENLCKQAEAFLRIPQPMVDDAVKRFGISAQAVRHLQKLSGASPDVALRRLIYDDPRAQRAGFIVQGLYVTEVALCNFGLPFGWLDQVPRLRPLFPDDAKLSVSRLPGRARLLGVCWE